MMERAEVLHLQTPPVLPTEAKAQDVHDNFYDMTRRELLEHLPPQSRAPIVSKIARMGLKRFQESYAIETPVITPETQLVDYEQLITDVSSYVDPEYRWKAPFFDEHHLYWYAHRYTSPFHPSPELAMEFRDLPIHKISVPRQFHNFVHVMTIPPTVPDEEVMRASVKEFRRRHYLYTFSSEAIAIQERLTGATYVTSQKGQHYLIEAPHPGIVSRHTINDPEAYQKRRENFINYIAKMQRKSLIDLSQLGIVGLADNETIEQALPQIREFSNQGIVRAKGHAALRVDIPYEKAA